jgi:hypothetical protein
MTVTHGDERADRTGSTGGAQPPSGHALGAHNRRALLAFGIFSGVLLLLVIVGAIARIVG